MGNHHIPCAYCGEDTRGLSGVRGCGTHSEAKKCYHYDPEVAEEYVKYMRWWTREFQNKEYEDR